MWIFARIIFVAIGFSIRLVMRLRKRFKFTQQSSSGVNFAEFKIHGKYGVVTSYLAIQNKTNIVFEITRENRMNRFLKAIGFAAEMQTCDSIFDSEYYVGSDHLYFNQALRDNAAIRQTIHGIISSSGEIKSIGCDGHALYIKFIGYKESRQKFVDRLHHLGEQILNQVQPSKTVFYKDPYLYIVVLFDAAMFASFFYGIVAFLEMVPEQYRYTSRLSLFFYGTIVGLIVIAILAYILKLILRKSARIQSVIISNLIFLMLGAPLWGTRAFAILNRDLDKSPISSKILMITRKEIRKHHGKNGQITYTYNWFYREPREPVDRAIQVPKTMYETANEKDQIEIQSRTGAFNYPYRISINGMEL